MVRKTRYHTCPHPAPHLTFFSTMPQPLSQALRWRLVTSYERHGSYRMAARENNCAPKTVRKWVKRLKNTGDVLDNTRSGRPRKLLSTHPQLMDLLEEGIRADEGCPQLASRVRNTFGIQVGPETVRRFICKHFGAKPLKPRRKPSLTTQHKAARLQFCSGMKEKYGVEPWHDVVVTDSKYFRLQSRGSGDKVWVIFGEDAPTHATEQRNFNVHVYAGVSKYGKTPLFCTVGTTDLIAETRGVNASVYLKLLQEELIPACRKLMEPLGRRHTTSKSRSQPHWVFQQDNAKAHTAKKVTKWLSQQTDFKLLKWPSKSPDLSWIENVWGYIAKKVNQRRGLTKENFKAVVMEEWENMPHEKLMGFYSSVPKRVQACIDAMGGITKY